MSFFIQIALTILLTVASAVLYRMGGSSSYNTKYRDVGSSLCINLCIAVWFGWHWSLILCFGALWGSLTTYWDFVNKWLPVEDKDKEYWWNWLLHGFFNAFSALPFLLLVDVDGIGFSYWFWIRCAVCAVATMLISILSNNVKVEECGRGAIPVLTVPIKILIT